MKISDWLDKKEKEIGDLSQTLLDRRAIRALVICQRAGQQGGIHATGMKWHFFTGDKAWAMQAAQSNLKNHCLSKVKCIEGKGLVSF